MLAKSNYTSRKQTSARKQTILRKNEQNTVNVFFASDRKYLPYLSVAIASLSKHANEKYFYNVRILSNDLTKESLAEIVKRVKPNVRISIFDVTDKISSIKKELALRLRDYYSDAIYYRLFIAEMFKKMKRAVYLDSDIVLCTDVAKLYFTDIGDNLLGAVTDESVMGVPPFREYVKKHVKVSSAMKYFNSGVLLMNLEKIREEKVKEQFLTLLCKYNFKTVAPDQDYLNFLCRGQVHYLESGWNKHAIHENKIDSDKLYIMHFNMFNKPWHYDGVQNENLFWECAKETAFEAELLREKNGYTDGDREKDAEAAEKLVASAAEIANTESISFRKRGKINDGNKLLK